MKVFTIGFTKKSAETFFTRLKEAGVKRLIDVRLNSVSQLAGFTKKHDLRFFTKAICGIDYFHLPKLAPTADILDPYKKAKNGDWELSERQFLDLMRSPYREHGIARCYRWRLLTVQRGNATSLSPPSGCGIPQGALAGYGYSTYPARG